MSKKIKAGLLVMVMIGLIVMPLLGEAKKKHHPKKHTHCATRQRGARAQPLLTGEIGLQRIVDEMNRRATAGVVVASLKTGSMLYQQAANQSFSPASNMKVITAFAALKFLGPDFVYTTRLMADPGVGVNQGVLEGNLYVQYSGDPSLQLEDLNKLFAQLRAQGVHAIRGRLMVDTSRYAEEGISPGTELNDEAYCYGAPVSTAIINRNCVSFNLLPAKTGHVAQVSFPYNVPLPVENEVVTRTVRNCHPALKAQPGGYVLEGCVRPGHKPVPLTVVVPVESHYGEKAAATLLARNGIAVMGNVLSTPSEGVMQVLEIYRSPPLSALVVDMMKRSDNIIANTLFKTIGALYQKAPATWENSAAAVTAILKSNQINTEGMQIIDGAGLSRDNRVTPLQLLEILRVAYYDPRIAPIYLEAMPVGGLNGTLRHRLGAKDIIGKVKAKTGTMHGISSLSGYVEASSGEMLAFSIIVNDFNGGASLYRVMQDKLCRVLRATY